jgi:hypothetical protein
MVLIVDPDLGYENHAYASCNVKVEGLLQLKVTTDRETAAVVNATPIVT